MDETTLREKKIQREKKNVYRCARKCSYLSLWYLTRNARVWFNVLFLSSHSPPSFFFFFLPLAEPIKVIVVSSFELHIIIYTDIQYIYHNSQSVSLCISLYFSSAPAPLSLSPSVRLDETRQITDMKSVKFRHVSKHFWTWNEGMILSQGSPSEPERQHHPLHVRTQLWYQEEGLWIIRHL